MIHFCSSPNRHERQPSAITLVVSLLALILAGCAGGRHYHAIPAEGPPPTPRYLQLEREAQVATLHFPVGVYSLNAEDDVGYYYAAPQKIAEHTSIGSHLREGGIYVNKQNPSKLRGYVYWGGVRTHVGNLSRVKHEFRSGSEQPEPEDLTTNEPAFEPATAGRHQ